MPHHAGYSFSMSPPDPMENWSFDVFYDDATSERIVAQPTNVLSTAATTAPVGPGNSATPTFTWTLPANPPPLYSFTIRLSTDMGGNFWEARDIPSWQTSLMYQGAPLMNGNYRWTVDVYDADGNHSANTVSFGVGVGP
jgi:hypothetical protein